MSNRDVIADLGAGTGVITEAVASRAPARIYAVEIDPRFRPFLEPLSQRFDSVEVIWGDILEARLHDVTKVVANPPFRLSEQLPGWLRRVRYLTSATLVMGRSFGRAAVARPGTPHYSRLSLNVQSAYVVTMVAAIAPAGFHPPTRTPACLLHLVPRRPRSALETTVDDAFSRRAGIRVKDLLRHLRNDSVALGSLARRHQVIAAVRSSPTTRRIHQRRLQELRSIDLSLFMAELLQADADLGSELVRPYAEPGESTRDVT